LGPAGGSSRDSSSSAEAWLICHCHGTVHIVMEAALAAVVELAPATATALAKIDPKLAGGQTVEVWANLTRPPPGASSCSPKPI
jgi:hypothetical protein